MNEVEAKILEVDVDEIRKKLLALGARLEYKETQICRILDFDDKRLHEKGEIIRVRKVGNKVELTFKGPTEKIGNTKSREEIETHVEDFETALKIFEKIGLTPVRSYEKHRESYKLGNITFELDNFPNIPVPPFLEIEGTSREEVVEMAEKLGFKKEELKSFNGLELLKHYNVDMKDIR
jgi:adenylate cyclase class 2